MAPRVGAVMGQEAVFQYGRHIVHMGKMVEKTDFVLMIIGVRDRIWAERH